MADRLHLPWALAKAENRAVLLYLFLPSIYLFVRSLLQTLQVLS